MFVEPGIPMPITKESYLKIVSVWLKIIKYKESGTIIFPAKSDRLRRLNQLLADKKTLKKYLPNADKTLFFILDPDVIDLSDEGELKELILKQTKGVIGSVLVAGDLKTIIKKLCLSFQVVFIILAAEKLFLDKKEDCLAQLALQQGYNPFLSILLFSEIDLTHPSFLSLLTKYSVFCQNINLVPLYNKNEDLNCFIKHNEVRWQMKVNLKNKKIIKDTCQHYWLMKEAIRYNRDNPKEEITKAFLNETMLIRLKILFDAFLPGEKSVFKKIILKQPILDPEEKHSLSFLIKTGWLKKNKKQTKISIPLFEKYITDNLSEEQFSLNDNQEIILNNVVVNSVFSLKEQRILKQFIQDKGKLVSRDELAKLIWGDNYLDLYSDWTIDQTVSRLRRKIARLGVMPVMLKTIKKQGFILAPKIN